MVVMTTKENPSTDEDGEKQLEALEKSGSRVKLVFFLSQCLNCIFSSDRLVMTFNHEAETEQAFHIFTHTYHIFDFGKTHFWQFSA